jgi:hypothetical protein
MIGKPQWFRRRKYTGWGFTPVTWEGWLYVVIAILPLVLLMGVSPISQTRMIFIITWALVVGFDFVDIMIHLPKDERDLVHEAIAERNALWVILGVLTVGVGYQVASGAVMGITKVDPVIIVAILAGLLTKMISNFYLDRKD